MADIADNADGEIERQTQEALRVAAKNAAAIPKGVAGVCEWCDEHFERLVGGACGRCRDYHRLG